MNRHVDRDSFVHSLVAMGAGCLVTVAVVFTVADRLLLETYPILGLLVCSGPLIFLIGFVSLMRYTIDRNRRRHPLSQWGMEATEYETTQLVESRNGDRTNHHGDFKTFVWSIALIGVGGIGIALAALVMTTGVGNPAGLPIPWFGLLFCLSPLVFLTGFVCLIRYTFSRNRRDDVPRK